MNPSKHSCVAVEPTPSPVPVIFPFTIGDSNGHLIAVEKQINAQFCYVIKSYTDYSQCIYIYKRVPFQTTVLIEDTVYLIPPPAKIHHHIGSLLMSLVSDQWCSHDHRKGGSVLGRAQLDLKKHTNKLVKNQATSLQLHVGAFPDQSPEDWQYLVDAPTNKKPSLHWYVAVDPTCRPLTLTLPYVGAYSFGQRTAN